LDAMLAPGVGVQIVHQVAAADDQNPFLTQGCESLPESVMKDRRLRFVDAQLHDRDIGLREDVTKHGLSR